MRVKLTRQIRGAGIAGEVDSVIDVQADVALSLIEAGAAVAERQPIAEPVEAVVLEAAADDPIQTEEAAVSRVGRPRGRPRRFGGGDIR